MIQDYIRYIVTIQITHKDYVVEIFIVCLGYNHLPGSFVFPSGFQKQFVIIIPERPPIYSISPFDAIRIEQVCDVPLVYADSIISR